MGSQLSKYLSILRPSLLHQGTQLSAGLKASGNFHVHI